MGFPTAPWSKDYANAATADGVVEPGTLHTAITNEGLIVPGVWAVTPETPSAGNFRVEMKGALDASEEAALDALVAAHVGTVTITEKSVVALDAPARSDNTPFFTPKASGQGFILCDRDILIRTATTGAAIEDLRVNADGSREDWGEAALVDVYKPADPAQPHGALVEVADQADAALNATCTIVDYLAVNQNDKPNNCTIEIRGGSLYTDLYGAGLGVGAQREAHQIYAVLAPNIPAAQGGRITFFDAYLAGYEQDWMEAISTDAMPVPHDGPAGVEGARLRVWIFYPAGQAILSHILRLVTYRTPGTF